jgi:predicted Zn-dependent protease
VDAITKQSKKNIQSKSSPVLKSSQFLNAFDGLNIGDNPEYGYVHEGVFYHPTDLYSFELAEGWQTAITPTSLSLGDTDGEAILSFMVEEDSMTFKQYLTKFEKAMQKQTGTKPANKKDFEWYGHKGEFLEYTSNAEGKTVKFQLIALNYGPGKIFKIAALFAESSEEKVRAILKNAQPVDKSSLPKTTVPTLKVVKANKGETLRSIIDRTASKKYTNLILLLNEKELSSQFNKGELVKTVIDQMVSFH